ncbi:MAG: hypothetical protein E7666_02015 [Ruminococcaceae bacterium]|nr:hypothetical protein [Oscillospiraceae bacterium]
MKKMIRLLPLLLVCVLLLSACSKPAAEKTFTFENMSITLTEDFEQAATMSFDALYNAGDIAVFVLKDPMDEELTADLSLEEYLEGVNEAFEMNGTDIVTEDGLTYLTYTNVNNDLTSTFFTCAYKSEDAFWLFQFGCAAADYNGFKDDIYKYAKSVTFS